MSNETGRNGAVQRVILLGKSVTMCKVMEERELPPEAAAAEKWLSLGYFDSMRIYPLPVDRGRESWLKALWRHSIELSAWEKGEVYYHPLYILEKVPEGESEEEREKRENFWPAASPFLCVTLVHGVAATREEAVEPEKTWRRLKEIVDGIDALRRDRAEARGLRYQCYQSMDLSDMVIVWQSPSLLEVLERAKTLYQHKDVGDLNTICGLSYAMVEAEQRGTPGPPYRGEERLPYVSVRSSTKDTGWALAVLDRMKADWKDRWGVEAAQKYFTTGSEDVNFTYFGITTRQLVWIMGKWFLDPEIRPGLCNAFYESSTHLGLDHPEQAEKRSLICGEESQLTAACRACAGEFSGLRQEFRRRFPGREASLDYSWFKLADDLFNALISMSRNCVLDGFSFLILDSLQLFNNELGQLLERGEMADSQLEELQRFIRGWGILTEQAVRADGQFAQAPGFTPVLYDIPASLLEAYIAFTKLCSIRLQEGDERRLRFAFMAVPKLCRRIKTDPVFEGEPPRSRLLYIDIPLDLLYDPGAVLCGLCHEVAHFSGEKVRCREERLTSFLSSAALQLANCLKLDSWGVAREIAGELKRRILGLEAKEWLYMDRLAENITDALWDILNDSTLVSRWQGICLQALREKGADGRAWLSRSNVARAELIGQGLSGLDQDIRNTAYLFEECFADLTAVCLMKLSAEEYLRFIFQSELRLMEAADGGGRDDGRYKRLVMRAALVIAAAPEAVWSGEPFSVRYMEAFAGQAGRLCRQLGGEQPGDGAYPIPVLNQLEAYLKACRRALAEEGEGSRAALIAEAFGSMARAHSMDDRAVYQVIRQYREGLISAPAIGGEGT